MQFQKGFARQLIDALWSPAWKGLTSRLSFVMWSLSHWYTGSGVVFDCIDSRSLPSFFLLLKNLDILEQILLLQTTVKECIHLNTFTVSKQYDLIISFNV